jgi:hypothetical protein
VPWALGVAPPRESKTRSCTPFPAPLPPHARGRSGTTWGSSASQPPAVFRPYPWLGPAPSAMLMLLLSTTYILSPLVSSTSTESACWCSCKSKHVEYLRAEQSPPLPALRRQAPQWARGWMGDPRARQQPHLIYIYVPRPYILYLILSLLTAHT